MQLGGSGSFLALLAGMVLRAARWRRLKIPCVPFCEERDEAAFEGLLYRPSMENWGINLHMLLVTKPGKW